MSILLFFILGGNKFNKINKYNKMFNKNVFCNTFRMWVKKEKSNLKTNSLGQIAKQGNFSKHSKKNEHLSSDYSKKIQGKTKLQSTFYKASITLVPKPDKYFTKK